MGLIRAGALWSTDGPKSLYGGTLSPPQGKDAAAKQKEYYRLVQALAQGQEVRVVILPNNYAKGPKDPVAVLLFDDGEDQRQEQYGYTQPQQGYGSGPAPQAPRPPQQHYPQQYAQQPQGGGGYPDQAPPRPVPYLDPVDW